MSEAVATITIVITLLALAGAFYHFLHNLQKDFSEQIADLRNTLAADLRNAIELVRLDVKNQIEELSANHLSALEKRLQKKMDVVGEDIIKKSDQRYSEVSDRATQIEGEINKLREEMATGFKAVNDRLGRHLAG